ncbi:FAD-dependent oxidoreductase [Streptomyces sp. NPDC014894]|uniref:FAD-dependent oxidoreductase n=1 Tax=unclassified Streptomyces TaxID=2593676 RepID=UPI00370169B2
MSSHGSHAVVMGGSIGGLVAARVLASRFDRVTVLDRDELPDDGRDRRGVPQAGHAHTLLVKGRQTLEELFPGVTDELLDGGAVPFDMGRDTLFHHGGHRRIRFHSGLRLVTMSRPFLERTLRRRVRAQPHVDVRERTAVQGLLGTADRITGVVVEGGETIRADLVVDATGRGSSRTDRWLKELGCPTPEESSIRIDVGYTTRLYRREAAELPGRSLAYVFTGVPPHDKRAVAVAPIEGDRWIVTLGGWHRANAPVGAEGFERFAAGLPLEHVAELLATTEPVEDGDARRFTAPTARRRHYERLAAPPAGFVALGDAICSFNPFYGQGMTVAILEAVRLGRCLDRYGAASPRLPRAYFREVAEVIDMPWQLSTGSDFMYPETVGRRPRGHALRTWYVGKVVRASHVSARIHRMLLEVTSLLARPSVLFRPGTVVRALWAARRARLTVPVTG